MLERAGIRCVNCQILERQLRFYGHAVRFSPGNLAPRILGAVDYPRGAARQWQGNHACVVDGAAGSSWAGRGCTGRRCPNQGLRDSLCPMRNRALTKSIWAQKQHLKPTPDQNTENSSNLGKFTVKKWAQNTFWAQNLRPVRNYSSQPHAHVAPGPNHCQKIGGGIRWEGERSKAPTRRVTPHLTWLSTLRVLLMFVAKRDSTQPSLGPVVDLDAWPRRVAPVHGAGISWTWKVICILPK